MACSPADATRQMMLRLTRDKKLKVSQGQSPPDVPAPPIVTAPTPNDPPVSEADRWHGYIDRIEATSITGWACDKANPNLSVLVEAVLSNGKRVIAAADLYREDVRDAGFGDGKHGFYLDLNNQRLQGQTAILRFCENHIVFSREPITFDPDAAILTNSVPQTYARSMRYLAEEVRDLFEEQNDGLAAREGAVTG